MRMFIDLGYTARMVVDLTPAELDTFTKVLDRARPCDSFYGRGQEEIKLSEEVHVTYSAHVVPTSVKLVEYVAPVVEA